MINGERKAECKYCHKKLAAAVNYGTSHLHNHLLRCSSKNSAGDILLGYSKKGKRRLDVGNDDLANFDPDVSRRELAYMIALHEFPLSIVEYAGVRRFAKSLRSSFTMVSRNTIKGDILNIYEEGKTKVMAELAKNNSRVATTTDMWTSKNKKKGFMVVTSHYIDDNWLLQSRIMRFTYVPSPHNSDTLCDVLHDCLSEWDIDRKLSAVIVDNCTTNDAMVRALKVKLQEESLILKGDLVHMRCAAHILNLIVRDGISVIEPCVEKIRKSVSFWTSSQYRRQTFAQADKLAHIACSRELVHDCKTRWNSTHLMISTALIYRDVFYRLKLRHRAYDCWPTEDEWDMASEISKKLELFHEVTKVFSATYYPTSNILFPKICEVKIALRQWVASSDEVIQNMAKEMLLKFNWYWEIIHGTMAIAIILDLRYKMKLLDWEFPLIYGVTTYINEVERIKNMFYNLVDEYNNVESSTNSTSVVPIQPGESTFLGGFDSFIGSTIPNEGSRAEFDKYLEEKLVPRIGEFDILASWKNQTEFPTLRLIVKDILAIPMLLAQVVGC